MNVYRNHITEAGIHLCDELYLMTTFHFHNDNVVTVVTSHGFSRVLSEFLLCSYLKN